MAKLEMFFDNYTELNMNLKLKETWRNLFVMISTWPKKYTFVYFPFKCFIIFIVYLIPLDLCILLSFFNVFFIYLQALWNFDGWWLWFLSLMWYIKVFIERKL